jgi:hypothetical protein
MVSCHFEIGIAREESLNYLNQQRISSKSAISIRCSSDKNLSKTTILERAKNAWKELERMFGANKQKSPVEGCSDNLSLNLDRDMLEGLKSLFQAHRDYLYYLVKEMGIDTSDEKGLTQTSLSCSLIFNTTIPDNFGKPFFPVVD